MRIGNWEVQPLGGWMGCLAMIAASILLSIILTVLINVVF
jgi:hypothetical protein